MASPGIEPGSGASETLILSIVLRGHYIQEQFLLRNSYTIPARMPVSSIPFPSNVQAGGHCTTRPALQVANVIEPRYSCFNCANIRSVSSFLQSSVPAFNVAAVPAATP